MHTHTNTHTHTHTHTQSPVTEVPPVENTEDVVFDDSSVSDTTSSSNNSGDGDPLPNTTSDSTSSGVTSMGGVSTSEKWAQVRRVKHIQYVS